MKNQTAQVIICLVILIALGYLLYKYFQNNPIIVSSTSTTQRISSMNNCTVQQDLYDKSVAELGRLKSVGASPQEISAQQIKVNAAASQLNSCKNS